MHKICNIQITCKKCRGECHSACVRARIPGFVMEGKQTLTVQIKHNPLTAIVFLTLDSKRFLCDGCKASGCTAMTSLSENNN